MKGVQDLVLTLSSRRTRLQVLVQEDSFEEEVGYSYVEWLQGASECESEDN